MIADLLLGAAGTRLLEEDITKGHGIAVPDERETPPSDPRDLVVGLGPTEVRPQGIHIRWHSELSGRQGIEEL